MKSKSFLLLFFKKEDLSSLENIRAAGAKKINHDDTKNTKIVTKRAQPVFLLGEKRRGLRAFVATFFLFFKEEECSFLKKRTKKLLLVGFLFHIPACALGQGYTITLPTGLVPARSRVLSIDLEIAPGHLTGISGVPAGWRISVSNDGNQKVHIVGGCALGPATLPPKDLASLRFQFAEDTDAETGFSCAGSLDATSDFSSTTTYHFSGESCNKTRAWR